MADVGNSIIIKDLSCFNIRHILECGQIFRYLEQSDGSFRVFSKDKSAVVIQERDMAQIITDDPDYFTKLYANQGRVARKTVYAGSD